MIEKVVYLNRVSKTVKGGRVMKFSALVVVGDGKGTVGYGLGKAASEVSEAILKGIANAKKNLSARLRSFGTTIPHDMIGIYGAGSVLHEAGSCRYRRYRRRRSSCGHGSGRYHQHPYKVPALQQPSKRCEGYHAGTAFAA
jgi:hypothetical protein